jgi:rsbT co-antagonist protein RsbR
MTDPVEQAASRALLREMGLDDAAIERRKKIVGFVPADVERIASLEDLVTQHTEDYVTTFFGHLSDLDEARTLFASPTIVERARQLKREHLAAMVQGEYGAKYVEQRLELGLLYSRAGLDPLVFLGAFHVLLKHVGVSAMRRFERRPLEGFESFMSLKKIAFFDIGLIVDILVFERERVIRQQQEAIRELSTPVLQIRERLLLLPIIGVLDAGRARLITESLLLSIGVNRAKVVVMDVTGVATIDSNVANHLLQTVEAARLMGAHVIVTGLSSEVAQSLFALGIELSRLNTVGDLQGGLEQAARILGDQLPAAEVGAAPTLGAM